MTDNTENRLEVQARVMDLLDSAALPITTFIGFVAWSFGWYLVAFFCMCIIAGIILAQVVMCGMLLVKIVRLVNEAWRREGRG